MITDVSEVQPSNAQKQIFVTEDGMLTDVSEVQNLNAATSITVTPSGNSACPSTMCTS